MLPTVGAVNTGATDAFSHGNESASPGSYTVSLNNGVKTELTATTRSGMARFTFPSTTQANLIFKLTGSQNGDSNTQFTVVSNTEVSGQVTSGHFCGAGNTYTVYFDMVFDQPFASNGTAAATTAHATPRKAAGKNAAEAANKPVLHGAAPKASRTVKPAAAASNGYVTFNTTSNPVVQAKVGISYVSAADAVANRTAENPNWDFDSVSTAAQNAWNTLLGRVQIGGGTARSRPSSTPRSTTRCCTRTSSATPTASTTASTARPTPSTRATAPPTPTTRAGTSTAPRRSSKRSSTRRPPPTPPSRWSTTTRRPASSPSGRRTTASPT